LEHVESSNSAPEIPVTAADPKLNGQDHLATTPVDIARKTMVGDLVDLVFEIISQLRDPWHKTPKKQQEFWRQHARDRIEPAVEQTVGILAAEGFPSIAVGLEQIVLKPKGIETKLVMSNLDRLLKRELVEAHGKVIRLVITPDLAAYNGARPQQAATADEPELPLSERIAALADQAEGLAADMVISEARRHGWEDGRQGVRDHAARWKPGEDGHGDYELGHDEGRAEREAAHEQARAEGAAARLAGVESEANPYPVGEPAERAIWLNAWMDARLALPAPAPDEDEFLVRGESPAVELGQKAAEIDGADVDADNPFEERQLFAWSRWRGGFLSQSVQQGTMRAEDAAKLLRDMGAAAGAAGVPAEGGPFPTLQWPERSFWIKGWAETTHANVHQAPRKARGEPKAPPKRRSKKGAAAHV
jgi:ribosome modulation factor